MIVFIILGKIPTGFRYQAKLHCECTVTVNVVYTIK